MAEAPTLTIEEQRKRLVAIRCASLAGDHLKLDAIVAAWVEDLALSRTCDACRGPTPRRLVPAKLLDYGKSDGVG